MEEASCGAVSVGLAYGTHSFLCVNQIDLSSTEEQKQRYLPELIRGERMSSEPLSEAGAGSVWLGIQLRAEKQSDFYILNGTKTILDAAWLWS